ncbi:unnamed protein product, partial [Scytosiphon promiscuus]
VYGAKVDKDGKPERNIEGADYLMDPAPQACLMDRDGRFIRYFRFSDSAKDMAAAINKAVN